MKKIGLLTFHRAINYGAVLQSYALQHYLSAFVDCEIINYHSEKIELDNGYPKNLFIYWLKLCYLSVFRRKVLLETLKKRSLFKSFSKKFLRISKNKYNKNNIFKCNDYYDGFVVGSDQVWNCSLTNNDYVYFLDFAKNKIKVSYAASIGGFSPGLSFKKYFDDFSFVSLRETSAVQKVRDTGFNGDVYVVCDPVFLLSKDEWISNLNLCDNNLDDYILFYEVAPGSFSKSFALDLSKKKGIKIKYVNLYGTAENCPIGFENAGFVGPLEFLSLLLKAKYVVTTSFHALAFSIIFNIKCYYELNKSGDNNNSRLENLSGIFGLHEFEIKEPTFAKDKDIDFYKINKVLQAYRNESIDFIEKALFFGK